MASLKRIITKANLSATESLIIGNHFNKLGYKSDAKEYYVDALRNGKISAANELGNMYKNNFRYIKAVKYYNIAIKKGDTDDRIAGLHGIEDIQLNLFLGLLTSVSAPMYYLAIKMFMLI